MAVWPAAAPNTHTDPRCVDGWHARNKPLTLRRCVCRVGTGMSGSRIGSKLGILPWARSQVVAESLGEVAIVPHQGSSAPTWSGADTWRRDPWHRSLVAACRAREIGRTVSHFFVFFVNVCTGTSQSISKYTEIGPDAYKVGPDAYL